jgi:hypothetical protein
MSQQGFGSGPIAAAAAGGKESIAGNAQDTQTK